MDPLVTGVLVFLIGLIAGLVGELGTGAGLISIPLLILLGFPSYIAIATHKLGMVGQSIGPVRKYLKEKSVVWKLVLPLTVISVVGSAVGASILVSINKEFLSRIVGLILLFLLPLIFLQKDRGIKRYNVTKKRRVTGFLVYFLIAIYVGFFGGGSGPMFIFLALFFFGLTMIELKATSKIPAFVANLSAVAVFVYNGYINYLYGVILFFSMMVGARVGVYFVFKKGNAWVKTFVVTIIIASSVKLLF